MLKMAGVGVRSIRSPRPRVDQAVEAWAKGKRLECRVHDLVTFAMDHLSGYGARVCGIVIGVNSIHIWKQKNPRRLSYYQDLYTCNRNDFQYLWWQEGMLREVTGEEFASLLPTLPSYPEETVDRVNASCLPLPCNESSSMTFGL